MIVVPARPRLFLNFALFQLAWFACVLGAAAQHAWLGSVVVLVVVALHLVWVDEPHRELQLILVAIGLGLVWDSLLVWQGVTVYEHGMLVTGFAPHWILALWAVFATSLNISLRWLHGRFGLAALFGAVGGALSFWAGVRLGAASIPDLLPGLLIIGAGWGVLMPVLVWAAAKLDGVKA